MRKLLQKLFSSFLVRLANKYSSRPDPERIHAALTGLYKDILEQPGKRGQLIRLGDQHRIILFSDQHKGDRSYQDDFALCEDNYLAALSYYDAREFLYCNLGDSEELWENTTLEVIKHNKKTFSAEKNFLDRNAYIKLFGNHDLYWDNDPLAGIMLQRIFGKKIRVYEGVPYTLGKDLYKDRRGQKKWRSGAGPETGSGARGWQHQRHYFAEDGVLQKYLFQYRVLLL